MLREGSHGKYYYCFCHIYRLLVLCSADSWLSRMTLLTWFPILTITSWGHSIAFFLFFFRLLLTAPIDTLVRMSECCRWGRNKGFRDLVCFRISTFGGSWTFSSINWPNIAGIFSSDWWSAIDQMQQTNIRCKPEKCVCGFIASLLILDVYTVFTSRLDYFLVELKYKSVEESPNFVMNSIECAMM